MVNLQKFLRLNALISKGDQSFLLPFNIKLTCRLSGKFTISTYIFIVYIRCGKIKIKKYAVQACI